MDDPAAEIAVKMRDMLAEADRNLEDLIASSETASVAGSQGESSAEQTSDSSINLGSPLRISAKRSARTNKRLRQGHAEARVIAAEANAELELIKSESREHISILQDKVNAARHRQLMVEQKLAAVEAGHRDEMRQVHQQTAEELEMLRKRLEEMENKTPSRRDTSQKLRQIIVSNKDVVSMQEYNRLCSVPSTRLSLEQQIQLQLYEITEPIRGRCKEAEKSLAERTESDKQHIEEISRLRGELLGKDQEINRLSAALVKIKNVDRRVAKLDDLELQVDISKRRNSHLEEQVKDLEGRLAVAKEEVDELQVDLTTGKQQKELLQMDKHHLNLQIQDLKQTLEHLKEKDRENQSSIAELEKKRDEAYERLLRSNQENAVEFERKLHVEVDAIREKNRVELLDLRDSAKNLYEKENRGYQNERDAAVVAREHVETELRDTKERLSNLQASYRMLQVNSENNQSELRSSLKMKAFEAERTDALLQESQANLKTANLEISKLQDKNQVLTKEFLELKAATDVKIQVLESRGKEDQMNLKSYAKLEEELDDVVMQAAESEDPYADLLHYGYGSDAPFNAKRRLKQSVALARKLLSAQKDINVLKTERDSWKKKHDDLTTEIERANDVIEKTRQPYNYLIEGMRSREKLLDSHKERISDLEATVAKLEKEKIELLQVRNAMSADLENLLAEDQEIRTLKAAVQTMMGSGGDSATTPSRKLAKVATRKNTATVAPASMPTNGKKSRSTIHLYGQGQSRQ